MKFRLILATGLCIGLLTVCAKSNETDIKPTVIEETTTGPEVVSQPVITEINEPTKPETEQPKAVEPEQTEQEKTEDWTTEVVEPEPVKELAPPPEVVEAEPDYITTTDEATIDEPEYTLEEEFPFPEDDKVCHSIGDGVSIQIIKHRVIIYKSNNCEQSTVVCFVHKKQRKKTHCIFDENVKVMIHENDNRLTKFKKERRGNHD